MDWYYAKDGQRVGPITAAELSQLSYSGAVTPEALVWREGWSDWRPFRDSAPALTDETGAGTCAECGRQFPTSEMVQFEGSWVCPTCKPIFFQKIKEGVPVLTQMRYAGFWIRFLAKFLDGVILQVVNIPVRLAFGTLTPQQPVHFGVLFGSIAVSMALTAAYSCLFVGRFGATPGKMACRLRIVTAAGERIGYGRALARYFAEILSSLILGIGYIMAAFDDQKRALHDRICDTRVIRLNV